MRRRRSKWEKAKEALGKGVGERERQRRSKRWKEENEEVVEKERKD